MAEEETDDPHHTHHTYVVYMRSDKTETHWNTRNNTGDLTLFEALELYITKGVTTEILDVINAYHDTPLTRSVADASILWDYHLSSLSEYNIDPIAKQRGETKAYHMQKKVRQ